MNFTLFTLPRLLSAAECEAMIAMGEARGFAPAPVTTAAGFQMRPDIRNNTRVMVDDVALAALVWERVAPALADQPGVLGVNERFRFYRYTPGQAFRWHFDGSFRRNAVEASRLTLMIYLNEGFRGGATEFEDADPVVPETGMALVFTHGLRHQGAPVLHGTKYVLRTDVMFRDAGSWE
jgi:prolyl 4-hydroxylase